MLTLTNLKFKNIKLIALYGACMSALLKKHKKSKTFVI